MIAPSFLKLGEPYFRRRKMEIRTLRRAFAVGVLAISSGYATQASASPSFGFTEWGGFTADITTIADYSPLGGVIAPAGLIHAAAPVYDTMSWVTGQTPQSSLNLSTVTGPTALPFATWTTISTLTHNNIGIPSATNWGPQKIWGRFIVTDSDGAPVVRLDSDDPITINFTETSNATPCPGPNPNDSTCDDHFTFTAVGLNSLAFAANDGTNWMADFRFANLVGATQIGETIYTAESQSSHMDVQVLVRQVPEPATLSLFGLGLIGLGFARRRQLNG